MKSFLCFILRLVARFVSFFFSEMHDGDSSAGVAYDLHYYTSATVLCVDEQSCL